MTNPIKSKILLAALLVGASATGVSAMSLKNIADAHNPAQPPLIMVHSLHNNCQYNSVTPTGTGNPKAWHKTAEAGVHTGCTPPRKPGSGKLTIQPRNGNSGNLKLGN